MDSDKQFHPLWKSGALGCKRGSNNSTINRLNIHIHCGTRDAISRGSWDTGETPAPARGNYIILFDELMNF